MAKKATRKPREKKPLEDEESYVAQTPPMNNPKNWITTGSLALDFAIGMGIPKGHIIEIYGESQTRKSSLACLIIAAAQAREDMRACWYSGEDGLPESVAILAGMNLVDLRYKPIPTVETLFQRAGNFSRKAREDGKSAIWVIDSLSALSCNARMFGRSDQKYTRPPEAMAINIGWQMGSHTLRKNGATALIISHKKGDSVPGGKATGFYSSVRLWTQLAKNTEEEDSLGYQPGEIRNLEGEFIGVRMIVDVAKTRFGPLARVPINFYYDRGFPIDPVDDMLSFLRTQGIMQQNGAWFNLKPLIEKPFYLKNFREIYEEQGKQFWDDIVQTHVAKRYAKLCENRGISPEEHEAMYAEFKKKEDAEFQEELDQIMAAKESVEAASEGDKPVPAKEWSIL